MLEKHLRLWSGLIVAAFVIPHLFNHSFGKNIYSFRVKMCHTFRCINDVRLFTSLNMLLVKRHEFIPIRFIGPFVIKPMTVKTLEFNFYFLLKNSREY